MSMEYQDYLDRTHLVNRLRDQSLLTCCCQEYPNEKAASQPYSWCGWENVPSKNKLETTYISMKQITKTNKKSTTKSKLLQPTSRHGKIQDRYVFQHSLSISSFAEEYRLANTSSYYKRDKGHSETTFLMQPSCCFYPRVLLHQEDSSRSQGEEKQKKVLSYDQMPNSEQQQLCNGNAMHFQVEWKLRKVNSAIKRYQLSKSAQAYPPSASSDYDPPISYGSHQSANSKTWREDYNSCSYKYDHMHASYCQSQYNTTNITVMDRSHLESAQAEKLKSSNGKQLAKMHTIPPSWRKRPPLMERRKSLGPYSKNMKDLQMAKRDDSNPQHPSIHNIQLKTYTFKHNQMAAPRRHFPPEKQQQFKLILNRSRLNTV